MRQATTEEKEEEEKSKLAPIAICSTRRAPARLREEKTRHRIISPAFLPHVPPPTPRFSCRVAHLTPPR
jgi:hypothetical protein